MLQPLVLICLISLFSKHFHLNSRKEFVSEVNTLEYFYTSQALASATVSAHGIFRLKLRRSPTPSHSLSCSAKISTAIKLINYALFAELLFLSGSDVLPNPGPVQSVAGERTCRSAEVWLAPPCCSCRRVIGQESNSIFCAYCDGYFHRDCVSDLDPMLQLEFPEWICNGCLSVSDDDSLSGGESFVEGFYSNDSTVSESETVDSTRDNTGSYFKLPLPTKGLRFGHWNINYLTDSKFEQIKLLLVNNSNCPDVFFITETFLKPSVCDSLFEIPGYTLLRKDRPDKAGGGVAVYCKDSLTFKRRFDLECNSVEILWLELCPYKSKRSMLFAGCYRPPSSTKVDDKKFEECIETAYLVARK